MRTRITLFILSLLLCFISFFWTSFSAKVWTFWDWTFQLIWNFVAWQKLETIDLIDIQDAINSVVWAFDSSWNVKYDKVETSSWWLDEFVDSFSNSWIECALETWITNESWYSTCWFKFSWEEVEFKWVIEWVSDNDKLLTLPLEYRPNNKLKFLALSWSWSSELEIETDWDIYCKNNCWWTSFLNLEQINYYVIQ